MTDARLSGRVCLGLLLTTVLAACSSGGAGTLPAASNGASTSVMQRRLTPQEVPNSNKELLYVAALSAGINVYSTSGKLMSTFATSTGANYLAMDDAGNAYVDYGTSAPYKLARYAIGAKQPNAKYDPEPAPQYPGGVVASPKGELLYGNFAANGAKTAYNVWDPGVTGKPSRIFKYPNEFALAMANNGTIYIPYYDNKTQTQRYDVIPAGASKPSRTIVDTIVTGPNAASFTPNWLAIDSNGTLYVEEYSYVVGDPLAGLYVYPSKGKETLITNGAASPSSIGLDASGNVYVLNSNWGYDPSSGNYVCDTLHTLTVYAPGGNGLVFQATSGWENGESMTTDASGTSFIDQFGYPSSQTGCADIQGSGGLASVLMGASSGNQIVTNLPSQNVVIYNGKTATNPGMQAR